MKKSQVTTSLGRFLGPCAMLAIVFSAGCSTTLNVEKVPATEALTEAKPGLRYSLPATFVAVEPDPAKRGGFTVEPVLLPDHGETYAINARTFLQSFTFNVELENGILKKVVLNQDSSELASQTIGTASELLKGELDKKAEEEKKAEEAAKAAAQKIQELENAVAAAEKEQQLAGEEVAGWERIQREPGGDTLEVQQALLKARLRLRAAEIDLQRAQQALAAAREASDDTLSSADEIQERVGQGQDAKEKSSKFPTVKGPVYYRLVDECDPWNPKPNCTVTLEPVDWPGGGQQRDFPVSAVPPPPPPPSPSPQLEDEQLTPETVIFDKGQYRRTLGFTRPVCELKETSKLTERSSPNVNLLDHIGLTLLAAKNKVELQIAEGALAAGDYRLKIEFTWGNCKKPERAHGVFELKIP